MLALAFSLCDVVISRTSAVVHHESIRSSFTVIAWLNLSQSPRLLALQQRCYQQLSDGQNLPENAQKSVERQLEELQRLCVRQLVLIGA